MQNRSYSRTVAMVRTFLVTTVLLLVMRENNGNVVAPTDAEKLENEKPCLVKTVKRLLSTVAIKGSYIYEYDQIKPFALNDDNVEIRYWNSIIGQDKSLKIRKGQENKIIKHWIPDLPLKVIIHGWLDSTKHDDGVFRIKIAYLDVGGFNVMTVDWGDIAGRKNYMFPAMMTTKIGKRLAEVLDNVVASGVVRPADVHLIGHSLGAHVAGVCGASLKSGWIGRITGLDPARPGFELANLQIKGLNRYDARFVDVVHTAGGFVGYSDSMGHADFFPNGGKSPQPGCSEGDGKYTRLFGTVGCSHSRAYRLYEDSVYNENSMMAVSCSSWSKYERNECGNRFKTPMGHGASPKSRGNFYLLTRETAPFGKDEHQKEDL